MGVKDVDGWALRDQMIAPFFSDYMHIVFGLFQLRCNTKKREKERAESTLESHALMEIAAPVHILNSSSCQERSYLKRRKWPEQDG